MKSCRSETVSATVTRVTLEEQIHLSDDLAVEEPLEIRVVLAETLGDEQSLAVTMRTPGQDGDLAVGFLFTEGLIRNRADVVAVEPVANNAVRVVVGQLQAEALARTERHGFVSSSCGVCGKRTIAAVQARAGQEISPGPVLAPEVLLGLPARLREAQGNFARTGGIHASALFDMNGNLDSVREDVGRHNALDKLIGAELLAGRIPVDGSVLLVSGRASFELVQKAIMAGIPLLAAVGAPSSLAVDLADRTGMTLVGFLRDGRFNVYAGPERIAGLTAARVIVRE